MMRAFISCSLANVTGTYNVLYLDKELRGGESALSNNSCFSVGRLQSIVWRHSIAKSIGSSSLLRKSTIEILTYSR